MPPEPNSQSPRDQRSEGAPSESLGEVVVSQEIDSRVSGEPGGSLLAVDGECVLLPIGDAGSWWSSAIHLLAQNYCHLS
jgi:hypothetical protein